MTTPEQLTNAQQNVCDTFYTLATTPDDTTAITTADQALHHLDTLLTTHQNTTPTNNT